MADPVAVTRAALVDAMAQAILPLTAPYVAFRHGAITAVDLAEAALRTIGEWTPPKPCPAGCVKGRRFGIDMSRVHAGIGGPRPYDAGECETCGGTGSLPPDPSDPPGIIRLLCEQVGWYATDEPIREFTEFMELDFKPNLARGTWEPVYRLRERKP